MAGVLMASDLPAGVFADTFRTLQRRGVVPGVLYPAVSIPSPEALAANRRSAKLPPALIGFLGTARCFLSINRFECKKARCCSSAVPFETFMQKVTKVSPALLIRPCGSATSTS